MLLFHKKEERAEPKEESKEESAFVNALLGNDNLTREKALQIPSVYASVNKIGEIIGTIPIRLYKKEEKEGKQVVNEVKKDNRLYLLNEDTKDTMTGKQFWKAVIEDYFFGKGAYIYINKVGTKVASLHYVREEEVSTTEIMNPIWKDYKILVRGSMYEPYDFIKILRNTKDGAKGISMVEEQSTAFSIAYESMRYENNLVKKGGNKKGFLLSEKNLAQHALDKLKEAWERLYRNNEDNVVILNNGLKFQESSNTSVEMQLNENKESNSKEMSMLFNIPNAIIKGNATKEDNKNFIKYCIKPLTEIISNSLNRDLLTEKEKTEGYYFAFDLKEVSRGDVEERYKAYEIGIKSHFLQPDEVRKKEDLEPLGIDWIELGLDSVLYNPKTKEIYTPNTNAKENLGKTTLKGGENDED